MQHPGAKMVIEVAEAQDDEVGDGTTTAVVLVGSLMEQAERLLNRKIHATVIAQGYRLGMEKALEIVNSLAIDVDPYNRDMLMKIADTAMTGKSIESVKGKLDGIVVDAVMTVAEKANKKVLVDEDDVMIKKQKGGKMDDADPDQGSRYRQGSRERVDAAKGEEREGRTRRERPRDQEDPDQGEDQDQLLGDRSRHSASRNALH